MQSGELTLSDLLKAHYQYADARTAFARARDALAVARENWTQVSRRYQAQTLALANAERSGVVSQGVEQRTDG